MPRGGLITTQFIDRALNAGHIDATGAIPVPPTG
jgi:hypothetical protein